MLSTGSLSNIFTVAVLFALSLTYSSLAEPVQSPSYTSQGDVEATPDRWAASTHAATDESKSQEVVAPPSGAAQALSSANRAEEISTSVSHPQEHPPTEQEAAPPAASTAVPPTVPEAAPPPASAEAPPTVPAVDSPSTNSRPETSSPAGDSSTSPFTVNEDLLEDVRIEYDDPNSTDDLNFGVHDFVDDVIALENKQSEEDIENGGLYDSLLSVFHDSASKESKDSSKEIQQLLEQAAEDIRDYHTTSAKELLVKASNLGSMNATYMLANFYLEGLDGDGANYKEAIRLLEKASGTGLAEAQSDLAFMHSTGLGTPQDTALGVLHYYFAATDDEPGASMALGYRHMYGIGVPKSCETAVRYYLTASSQVIELSESGHRLPLIERARLSDETSRSHPVDEDDDVIHYYEHAADGGDVNAQVVLGHLHQQGARGVQRDAGRAFDFFNAAATQGDGAAMAQLAQMYAEGSGVKQDNKTAAKFFTKAAQLGDASGLFGLGFLHLKGQGVQKDVKLAVKYFKEASDRGSPEAQFSLGTLYYTGEGVERSDVTALHYFTKAGHKGHITSLYNLAQMYLLGVGTVKSCSMGLRLHKLVAERGPWALDLKHAHDAYLRGYYEKALALFVRAADQGVEIAQANAGWMLDHSIGYYEDDHYKLAQLFWMMAADQGNSDAQRMLGDYYYYGRVGPADYQEAARRYQQSADRRNAQSLFNLGFMYQSGIGVKQDLHLSKRFYDQAVQVASEAFVPASLALLGLRLQTFFDRVYQHFFLPSSASTAPNAQVESGARREANGREDESPVDSIDNSWIEGEDVLLLILCGALAIAFYMRRHRLND